MLKLNKKLSNAFALSFSSLALAGALLSYFNPMPPSSIINSLPQNVKNSSLNKIIIQDSKRQRFVDRDEGKSDLQKILENSPFNSDQIKGLYLQSATEFSYLIPETDHLFSKKLKLLGNDSIKHLYHFLKSERIKQDKFEIFSPQNESEINSNPSGVEILIGSDIGTKTTKTYKISFNKGKDVYTTLDYFQPSAGESGIEFLLLAKKDGFLLQTEKNKPIYYNSSSDKVFLVESFAIEMLHRALRPYTRKHFEKEVSVMDLDLAQVNKSLVKWKDREETVVHAISQSWLRQYNLDRNLHITEKELEDRFSRYDDNSVYKDVNSFTKKINAIGVNAVIEKYAIDPKTLFPN